MVASKLDASPPADETEVVDALLASVDAFCHRHVNAREIDAAAGFDRSLLRELAELGLFGLSIPEAWDGYGLSLRSVGAVVAGLAYHDRALATTVGLHLGLGTRGLVAFGTDPQRDRWLPALAAGSRIAAFATTESEAGSDLAGIRTRGVMRDGWLVIDGEKIFVTNGGFADVFTITASTPELGDGRRGHSLVVLERGDAGLSSGREEHKLGLRGSSTTTLMLDGVAVGCDRVIGTPGGGMEHLAHVLAWGRTVMAAGCTGTARAAIDATERHLGARRQFGRTLISMDVVRAQLASMKARLHAARALVLHTSEQTDPLALAAMSASAKVFASEGAWDIVDAGLQLHGGSGFIEETGIALLLRDSRITRIYEGANDVLRLHRGLIEATRPLARAPLGAAPLAPVALAPVALVEAANAFDAEVGAWRRDLARAYGARLLARPVLLHAIGEAAILRDATDAAVREAKDPMTSAWAELWLAEARARFGMLLRLPQPAGLVDRALGVVS